MCWYNFYKFNHKVISNQFHYLLYWQIVTWLSSFKSINLFAQYLKCSWKILFEELNERKLLIKFTLYWMFISTKWVFMNCWLSKYFMFLWCIDLEYILCWCFYWSAWIGVLLHLIVCRLSLNSNFYTLLFIYLFYFSLNFEELEVCVIINNWDHPKDASKDTNKYEIKKFINWMN